MSGLEKSEDALQDAFDCALLDLDGVVYRGPYAVRYAPQAVQHARERQMRTMFVTNNASRTPDSIADHLTDLGVPTGPEEVTTAAMAVAALIASEADERTRVLPIGGAGLRQALTDEGLHLVDSAEQQPTVVVQGFTPQIGWADLAEAAYAVAGGAAYLASNLDQSLPTERGFAPGNGALVGAVMAATGVQPRSTGKPQPDIFTQAAAAAGALRALVVGDRLDTDLAGARAAGMPGLWVGTGVDGPTQVLRAPAGHRPAFLGADLRALAQAHPQPQRAGDWWTCRRAAARVDADGVILRRHNGELVLGEAVEIDTDELRAAAAACWAASDDAGADSVLAEGFPQVRLAGTETTG